MLHDYAVAKNRFALTGAPLIVDRNMIFYCSFVLSLPFGDFVLRRGCVVSSFLGSVENHTRNPHPSR